ncbi:MAG: ISAs1 family transposase [Akkermansia sp.]|nr:ISAs1 family transposase [Akkermansia sp.]
MEERVDRDLSFVTGGWNWEKLSALVVVESTSYNKKKQTESTENRCYITNLPRGSSAIITHAIRNHWQVESMHWVLDVVFGEDTCRKRVYNAAENYSRMMKVVLSLLRNHKKKSGGTKSLARMRKQAA